MSIQQQVHDRFKVFAAGSVQELDAQVRTFTSGGNIAAKSIGVEFVESSGTLVLSLGFREDADGYAVTVEGWPVGQLDLNSGFGPLERALEEAAKDADNVICHELFVDDRGQVIAVFLKHV